MKESDLNKRVQALIEANGGYVVKIVAGNRSGIHDMLACINGRFCSLEGKLSYNKMSPLQKAHRNKVIASGGLAMQIKSVADAKEMIAMTLTGEKQSVDESLTAVVL